MEHIICYPHAKNLETLESKDIPKSSLPNLKESNCVHAILISQIN